MTQLFISYAPDDRAEVEQCIRFLMPLVNNQTISVWSDLDVSAGQTSELVIAENLAKAHIILVLVSANYLASDELYNGQLQTALERKAKGEAQLIPIILSACLWEDTPMGQFSVLPAKDKSIQDYSAPATAWNSVVMGIKTLIKGGTINPVTTTNDTPPAVHTGNSSHTSGNGNIVIQGVNGGNISINVGGGNKPSEQNAPTPSSAIKAFVAKGKLDKALDALADLAEDKADSDLSNSVILLQGRLARLTRDENMEIIGLNDALLERNKLTAAVLGLVDEV